MSDKQKQVFEKIKEIQPCSNQQIARALSWEINRVTGRVNELSKMGLIKFTKYASNETGRVVKMWEEVK